MHLPNVLILLPLIGAAAVVHAQLLGLLVCLRTRLRASVLADAADGADEHGLVTSSDPR
jgi:hypothetical protein